MCHIRSLLVRYCFSLSAMMCHPSLFLWKRNYLQRLSRFFLFSRVSLHTTYSSGFSPVIIVHFRFPNLKSEKKSCVCLLNGSKSFQIGCYFWLLQGYKVSRFFAVTSVTGNFIYFKKCYVLRWKKIWFMIRLLLIFSSKEVDSLVLQNMFGIDVSTYWSHRARWTDLTVQLTALQVIKELTTDKLLSALYIWIREIIRIYFV